MKIDQKHKQECINADCGFPKERCLIYHGRDCTKLDGSKIPVQSSTVSESFPLTAQTQTTFKPYFIVDGKAFYEGREDD